MNNHIILCIGLLVTGSSAFGKTSGVSPTAVATTAATAPAKAVLVDLARPAPATLLLAEASEEVCSCKRWVIQREKVCVEPQPGGGCSKWEYVEVSRECLEYACHKK